MKLFLEVVFKIINWIIMCNGKIKQGFTLLELIIVIITVTILASVALPRFFKTIEYSRVGEAFMVMSSLRSSTQRCYVASSGTYVGCDIGTIDFIPPNTDPGTHFTYAIYGQTSTTYTIAATRNLYESGDGTSHVFFEQSPTGCVKSGDGAFLGVK